MSESFLSQTRLLRAYCYLEAGLSRSPVDAPITFAQSRGCILRQISLDTVTTTPAPPEKEKKKKREKGRNKGKKEETKGKRKKQREKRKKKKGKRGKSLLPPLLPTNPLS